MVYRSAYSSKTAKDVDMVIEAVPEIMDLKKQRGHRGHRKTPPGHQAVFRSQIGKSNNS